MCLCSLLDFLDGLNLLSPTLAGARRGASGAALGMPGGYRSVEPFHQSSYIHWCFNNVDLDVVMNYTPLADREYILGTTQSILAIMMYPFHQVESLLASYRLSREVYCGYKHNLGSKRNALNVT